MTKKAPVLDLDKLVLDAGGHSRPELGMCVTEAVSYVAGEPFSDHPECLSPTIGAFLRRWNDSLDDEDRQMLKPWIPKVIGTNTGRADEKVRGYLAVDWLVRTFCPRWLELAGIDWLIVGGESGPNARPLNLDHARELRDACLAECAGCMVAVNTVGREPEPCVTDDRPAFFFKQVGGRTPKSGGRLLDGREWNEIPNREAVPA